MFLKIAVHPNGIDAEAADPPIVQHWNTAAVTADDKWTLGRKAPANCIVRNDKTISREHVRISVTATGKKGDDDYTVSITNMGKLGSFLVVPDDDNDATPNTTADDGNDSDATPVDHHVTSQVSASQAIAAEVPLSDVSRRHLSNKKVHLEPIDVNQSTAVVLSTSDPHKPILLQCGRSGTTLVMSFVSIAVSGNPAKQAANPLEGVHLLVTEHVHPLFTACVVTSKRSVCTKQLTAYCSTIPLVHPSFLSAVVAYKDGTGTEWPDPAAHAPKPDNYAFWDEAPHDRTLWKACTFVRVDGNSAVEQLVEAAGVGHVVDVDAVLASDTKDYTHLFAVQSSTTKVKKLKKDFSVPTVTAKEIAKAISERRLLQDAKGQNIGVPYDTTTATETDAPKVVKAPEDEKEQVTSTERPSPEEVTATTKPAKKLAPAETTNSSTSANAPVETQPAPPPVNKTSPVPPTSSQTSNSQSQSRSLKKWEMDDSSDEDIAPTTTKSQPAPTMSETPVTVAPTAESQPAPRVAATNNASTSQWQTASQRHVDDSDDDDAKSSRKSTKKRQRGVRRKGGRRWEDSSDEEDGSPVKRLKSLSFVSDAKLPPEDAMDVDDIAGPSPSNQPPSATKPSVRRRETSKPSPPKRRTPVAEAPDAGWLTILPKDRARSRKEIMDITGQTDWIGEPITEFAPSLLEKKAPPPAEELRSVTPTASSRGPNFKAFRKNAVPSVYRGPAIELRAAAEPQSVSMVEANHAANAALVAQQRINDALFAGPASSGITSKARRRR